MFLNLRSRHVDFPAGTTLSGRSMIDCRAQEGFHDLLSYICGVMEVRGVYG